MRLAGASATLPTLGLVVSNTTAFIDIGIWALGGLHLSTKADGTEEAFT